MGRIGKVQLKPLPSKHYSTDVEVEVGGNGWDELGRTFRIEICGTGSKPSVREYERGYCAEEGMNHVESEEHYYLASVILEALRKANYDR